MAKPVIFRFAADVKALKQGLSETERDLQQFGRKVQRVGVGLTAGLSAPLAALGVSAVNAASDLDEALNVTSITFGEAADKIQAFGDTAAHAIGQSKRAAMQAATTFGGLLVGVGQSEQAAADMSITLTKLASDLASAFNTAPEDAVLALGSALRGESEPIRRYNVLLDDASVRQRAVEMGLAATTAEVDQQDKVLARYNLVLEQTERIQGDFANTADGLANSQRTLSAQWEDARAALGESLLPAAEAMVGVANDLLSAFTALPPDIQKNVVGIGALVAAVGPALIVTGSLIRNFKELRETLPDLASALGKGVGLTAVLVGVTTAAESAGNALREAFTDRPEFTGATADLQEFGQTGELAGKALQILGADMERFETHVRRLGQKSIGQNLQDALTLGFDPGSAQDARVFFEDLDRSLTSLAAIDPSAAAGLFDAYARSASEVGADLGFLLTLFPGYVEVLDGAEVVTNATAEATEELGESQRTTAREVKSLTDRLKDQFDQQREAASPMLAAIRATDRYEDAVGKLTEVQKDHHSTEEDVARATTDLLETLLEMQSATVIAEDDVAGFRSALLELEDQGYLTTRQVDLLAQSIGDLPDQKMITVGVVSTGDVFDEPLHNPLSPEDTAALKGFSTGAVTSSGGDTNITINNPRPHGAEEDVLTASRQAEFLR